MRQAIRDAAARWHGPDAHGFMLVPCPVGRTTAFIALGGNIGDVRASFTSARQALNALPDARLAASSLLYRTPALGPVGQPDYLNAVIAIETTMQPEALLDALQGIERDHGRVRDERWGPRTLDLDLLAIDALIIDSKRLILPHARLHERQFVLRPLCDIAPDWLHPRLRASASLLLQKLLTAGEASLPAGKQWPRGSAHP
jgi:2-amino-4-hydroxy-6-hydroxymethyldihydropteridine diphosphokinase